MLERKRNMLFLISQYLNDFGLTNTAEALLTESTCLCNANREYQICDNIDLDSIYLDYMSYHHLKFGKFPKILKKIDQLIEMPSNVRKSANLRRKSFQKQSKTGVDIENNTKEILQGDLSLGSSLTVSKLFAKSEIEESNIFDHTHQKILPILRDYEFYTPEWKEMADIIVRLTIN